MAAKVSVVPPPTPQSGSKRLIPQHIEEGNKKKKTDERQYKPFNAFLYQI